MFREVQELRTLFRHHCNVVSREFCAPCHTHVEFDLKTDGRSRNFLIDRILCMKNFKQSNYIHVHVQVGSRGPPWRARRARLRLAPRVSGPGQAFGPMVRTAPAQSTCAPSACSSRSRLRLARRVDVKWAPPPWRAPREAPPRSSRLGNLF